jgi:multiple sugar transport system permease protein/sn-glycerol 3-phosphate transport system permease protein
VSATRVGAPVEPERTRRPRLRPATVVRLVALSLGAFVVLTPVMWMLVTSVKQATDVFVTPPKFVFEPRWSNFKDVLTLVPFQRYFLNTATIVAGVMLGTLLSCSFTAYGFARLRAPGKKVIFILLMTTIMLPSTVTLVPTYIAFNRLGWINTFKPLILPAFFGAAFFIFLFRQFYLSIPRELEDAARIDGAGYLRIWWSIFLPLSLPVLATVTVFTFVGAYNDFFGPVIYLTDDTKWTVSVALSYFQGSPRVGPQMQYVMAATTLAAIPSVLIFIFAQRYFVKGIVMSGVNR